MHEYSYDIPQNIIAKLHSFFADSIIKHTLRLHLRAKVSLSFQKGSPDQFFVISGIVYEETSFEARISYKKGQSPQIPDTINSSCSCALWEKAFHCPHTALLFLLQLLQLEKVSTQISADPANAPTLLQTYDSAAYPQDYGTIIESPRQLLGHSQNTNLFSELKFLLLNKSTISFPTASPFIGKLLLYLGLEQSSALPTYNNSDEICVTTKYLSYKFRAQIREENLQSISIFENIFLFDWNKGLSYLLPDALISLIRNISNKGHIYSVEDLYYITTNLRKDEQVTIFIKQVPPHEIIIHQPKTKIQITPYLHRGLIQLSLHFYDENDHIIPVPKALSLWALKMNPIKGMKNQSLLLNLISALLSTEINHSFISKKYLRHSPAREILGIYVEMLFHSEFITSFDEKSLTLYHLSSLSTKKIFFTLYHNFGLDLFRNSSWNNIKCSIDFEIKDSIFFQGIVNFYKNINNTLCRIFYKDFRVGKWNSQIKLTREQTHIDWFQIHVDMPENDYLDIIKMGSDDNFLLSEQGLFILSEEEKNLIRFIKKYKHLQQKKEGHSFLPQTPLADITKQEKFIIGLHRARIFELFDLHKLGLSNLLSNEELRICQALNTLEELPYYPIPKEYLGIARPYQLKGYQWIRFLFEHQLGACLADDMGLGKTLQIIIFLTSVIDQIQRVLIICPVSLLINWKNEIKKFSSLEANIYYSGERKFPLHEKIIITSYGVMKKEVETTFKDLTFDVLVFDEVQHLKNVNSQGSKAAKKIKSHFRISMTGTPVENHIAEFYNILDLTLPGLWSHGQSDMIKGNALFDQRFMAKKAARPFILRRTKKQVLQELPEKSDQHVLLSLSPDEQKRYQDTFIKVKLQIQTAPTQKKYGEILKGLLILRQLCLWQDQGQKIISTKINFLMDHLEQILEEGYQVLVYSQFTTYLDIIEQQIKHFPWKFSRIDGQQTLKKRHSEVTRFQEGQTSIFLISLKAGGVGLNLTAASYVFLMDPWWNPAVEAQAIDRAHRIGQKNNITVYRPIIKNSVEEKVLQLQSQKLQLFEDIMSADQSDFSGNISMKDFENFFI